MSASLVLLLALAGCAPKNPAATAPAASGGAGGDVWSDAPAPLAEPSAVEAPPSAAAGAAEEPAAPVMTWGLSSTQQRQLGDAASLIASNDRDRAEAARTTLEGILKDKPDASIVHYNLGLAHQVLGNTDAARASWSRATELDPSFARAWLNLGVLAARAGRVDAALATFQAGLKHNSADMELRVATISALRLLKRHEEAVAAAKSALAINSRALGVYTALSQVYLDTNRQDLARFMLEKALIDIKGAGQDATLHAVLGQVYLRQGYEGDAQAEFKKALELDPYQVDALQALASWYLDNRNWPDATPLWERVVAMAPSQVGPRINLGISYRGEGRFEDARRVWEECLRIDPRNPEPYRNVAVLQGDYLKDYDGALATIELYRKAGGGPAAELDAWAEALKKDRARKLKAEERKRQEEERKRLDEERKRNEAATPAPAPAPEQPAPTPTNDPNPWGGGG